MGNTQLRKEVYAVRGKIKNDLYFRRKNGYQDAIGGGTDMTDKKIIDNLHTCVHHNKIPYCRECTYRYDSNCMNKVMADALDLIKRQQAEIERLKKDLQTQTDILESGANSNEFCFEEDKIRAEAIKELAGKLKEKTSVISFTSYSDDYIEGYCDAVDFYDIKIDNIIKEMESGQ